MFRASFNLDTLCISYSHQLNDTLSFVFFFVAKIMSLERIRNPMDRKIASDRFSYRDDPYRRDSRRTFRFFSHLH